MQVPHPPRPPYPPCPGLPLGEADPDLAAQLGGEEDERHHATALLLARHWLAARDYALLCLASATPTAHYVATSAFQRTLDRLASSTPSAALRPLLLVAVRETIRNWAADDRICTALPELRKPTGGRGLYATKAEAPANRKLAEHAFVTLSGFAQSLLWHTEVEAEPIEIPAGLLGMETVTARAAVERAREQFRVGLVRAHRQFAPSAECRFYNRLIDVPIQRGGRLLPDVQQHLARCPYCRAAADQLEHFKGGLGLLLVDAVLGWGGRRYLATRPGWSSPEEWAPTPERETTGPTAGGRHRTASEKRHHAAAAVALTSLALLVAVLAARNWSDDSGQPGPVTPTWGIPANSSSSPTAPPGTAPEPSTSPGEPGTQPQSRLRSLATGRCLAVDGRLTVGAGIHLTACSSTESERWSYEFDGLLRSDADPSFCLTADPRTRNVQLALCVVHSGEVSYTITARGELLLRGRQDLALAPGRGGRSTEVVVADRDASDRQRWTLEAAETERAPTSRT
ncbi:RICIN domain-containing protein [Streptomyces guryensis]|uniref:Ricin-type beta-trefoil lectin domain protein n=1 Tax=Streptomyces guryensis TaxID=2886947 RepID=A0A9Q3VW25_9ACTN|nr:RICIN domain-containing protein [Streptomyces guryensis]MCD9878438.1 ricin-type beta-trefoil lectin domain protein [Streptomyces guryensis]